MKSGRSVYTIEFSHPQKNLNSRTKRNPEEVFGTAFSDYYTKSFEKIHNRTEKNNTLFVREVPVFSNGIADLLAFSWNSQSEKLHREDIFIIRSFEFKIKDWRKGLMQAYRYRNYSNASILVMPTDRIENARKSIETFRNLKVGLWGFDCESGKISRIYTPRPRNVLSQKSRTYALKKVLNEFVDL